MTALTRAFACWLLAVSCLLAGVHSARAGEERAADVVANADDIARARQVFREGSALAEAGHWQQALERYEEAYRLHAHATTLYNIGYCHAQLGALTQALYHTARALDTRALAEGRRLDEQRRSIAEAQVRVLLAQLARLTLRTSLPNLSLEVSSLRLSALQLNDTVVYVPRPEGTASDSLVTDGAEVYLDPGAHELRFEGAGIQEVREIVVDAGDRSIISWPPERFTRPNISEKEPPASDITPARATQREQVETSKVSSGRGAPATHDAYRRAGVTSLAAGGAGLTLALGAAIVTFDADRHLSRTCNDGRCPEQEVGAVRRYRWGARLTNAGLLLGALGGAAGISLLLLATPNQEAVSLTIGPDRALVHGTF